MAHKRDSHEWLSLIDVSGPFLAVPVLAKAFPQGLDRLDSRKKKDLRQAYDEWREAQDLEDDQLPEIHQAWIELVLRQGLELDEDGEEDTLKPSNRLSESLSYRQPEYGVTLRPDYAVVDDQKDDAPLMLVSVHDPEVDLDSTMEGDGWATSPTERMVLLCRATETRLGLVTNGERWMLVDAPVGAVTTFASWYARLWAQEPITLQAFVTLLGIRRFFTDKGEQLPALLDASLQYQDEVTDALGKQVQRAVEVLIQALDRADVDRNRELLEGVEPSVLYEAALTVMMRLVFMLSAEERELMDVVKDERFDANYAVSSLRMQLREQAGLHSEEILSHRRDAWSRLLAIFRAVYGGIEHETLRMPALGGSLFDPDRFPFLEGRAEGTYWQIDEAKPLPIDNRTVLLLLDAIQLFQGRTLSYRALDVENIGYVYEGLLERTVERANQVTLDLDATKSAKKPWVSLEELELAEAEGQGTVEKLLKERTGSAISRVRNDLKKTVDPSDTAKLLTACHNDQDLCDRVEPYFHLLRIDGWGYPLVYPEGTFMVTTGTDRRETGTHYTPKSLTESIVKETLEPIVYLGPAEGRPREEWQLRSPSELLNLKVCDPAMGSGAFLVQVCRWLAERLVESWEKVESKGRAIDVDGAVHDDLEGFEPLSMDSEERMITARRLIAERCLYGVDINPLAVELAKLSIWLVTLSKGRPFGFLDHSLRSGDSLLGIHDIEQLIQLHPDPTQGDQLHSGLFDHRETVRRAVERAMAIRFQVRTHRVREIGDVQEMARLNASAQEGVIESQAIADAIIGEVLANPVSPDNGLVEIAVTVGAILEGDESALQDLRSRVVHKLATDHPAKGGARHPFHWVLEYPEVFQRDKSGFDAIVGNPPFLGGRRMRRALGDAYVRYLTSVISPGGSANADLCSFFVVRASQLTRRLGAVGQISTSSISEGDSRKNSLLKIKRRGWTIFRAFPLLEWPGNAAVTISLVWLFNGSWKGKSYLGDQDVTGISSDFTEEGSIEWEPVALNENKGKAFQGSNILGKGFVLEASEAEEILHSEPESDLIISPFLQADDVVGTPELAARKKIIDFRDMPLSRSDGPQGYQGPVAEDYPLCLSRVREKVKPGRDNQKRKPYREKWWQYAERCNSLYTAIGMLEKVIFQPSPSKHLLFVFVDRKQVFSGPHTVIASDRYSDLGVLLSSVHAEWCWKYSSTMPSGSRRYNPADYLKFPFPSSNKEQIDTVGKKFNKKRLELLREWGGGLRDLLNDFHDPENTSPGVLELREMLAVLDHEILQGYGWSDVALAYEFRRVGRGLRYGFQEEAGREVLLRLLRLNKARSERK